MNQITIILITIIQHCLRLFNCAFIRYGCQDAELLSKESSQIDDIRPVISNLSEITEKIIFKGLKNFADAESLIPNQSFSFQPKHYTTQRGFQ